PMPYNVSFVSKSDNTFFIAIPFMYFDQSFLHKIYTISFLSLINDLLAPFCPDNLSPDTDIFPPILPGMAAHKARMIAFIQLFAHLFNLRNYAPFTILIFYER